jgi:hypothetical protein
MKIEMRERTIRGPNRPGTPWGAWATCEGAEQLTQKECEQLVRDWSKDGDCFRFREEFRIVPD